MSKIVVNNPKQVINAVNNPKQVINVVNNPKQVINAVNNPKQVINVVNNPKQVINGGAKKYYFKVKGLGGLKGEDGFSPIATVTQTSTGATISITDAQGTTTADISNGTGSNVPIATTAVAGKVKPDGTTITVTADGTISSAAGYVLPAATTSTLGGVIVGNNLTVDANGTLDATDTTYTAGTNVQISAGNVISATDTTYSTMTGASSGAAGTGGLVPAPAAGDESKVLSGAGTWVNQSGGSTYTAGNGISISANDEISIDTNVVAELSDLPTVNNGTLTIQQNGTTVDTFTANSSADKTVNIETIYADDYISTSPIPTTVTTAMIEDEAVTTAKIEDGAVTAAKTAFGGSYSTNEVDTGFTWIDGKHIYKKTFSFTLANAEATTINHGISNFGILIKYEGAAISSSTKSVPIPRTLTNINYQVGLEGVTTTSFEIDVASSGPRGKQAYITLWYTKTTD